MPKNIKENELMIFDFLSILVASCLTFYLSSKVYFSPVSLLCSFTISLLAIFIFKKSGLYEMSFRFMPEETIRAMFSSLLFISLVFFVLSLSVELPVTVLYCFIFGATSFLLNSATRLLINGVKTNHRLAHKVPVLIYGAGSAGRQLASALYAGEDYAPRGYLDDNAALHGLKFQGVKVYSPDLIDYLLKKYQVKKVLLAIPSATKLERKRALEKLEDFSVEVKSVAGAAEIISGMVEITQLQDLNIEDLLSREPVKPSETLMGKCIEGKSILITGAGGSIGSELCRQIIQYRPSQLILLDISEFGLYSIDAELKKLAEADLNVNVVPVLGSVVDKSLLESIVTKFHVDNIYHAAAYKHVPLVEFNVSQSIQNNILGTYNCAKVAMECKVESFILISSDKAVRPTNFMGASKRASELVLQAFADTAPFTKFSMVRFGNVLGSSGSVVPVFKKQILNGGPVTVTHKEITRYFMTIPEAAQLVIQSGAMAKGGDVFVLDMGEPVKIASLAEKMIRLMGYEVKGKGAGAVDEIEITYSGLRPGEKLYEELLVSDDVSGTIHPRIMTANDSFVSFEKIEEVIASLQQACKVNDCEKIKRILNDLPIQFQHGMISDILWGHSNVNKLSADVIQIES